MTCLSFVFALAICVATLASNTSHDDPPLAPIRLIAADGSIKANFIACGATVTNLWVKDKDRIFRDILLGFDNYTHYVTDDLGHSYFGPIVGRYANRIRNGTFTIPISKHASGSGKKYHISENENNGTDTLHGGFIGFDRRNWTIAEQSSDSVTFTLFDKSGTQGFPGNMLTTVTYTLGPKSTWSIKIHATADHETPILLSGHHYWNLEAYQETQDLSGHYAWIDSSKIIATDGLLTPNGSYVDVNGTALDFRKGKSLGQAINDTGMHEYCGTGCVGFDNCFIYDNNTEQKPVFSLWSVNSGIKFEVTTNQPALQMYSCNNIYNSSLPVPRKQDQGSPSTFYNDHTCVVIEQESYIDGINNPEYPTNEIYGPGRDYNWESKYVFSVLE